MICVFLLFCSTILNQQTAPIYPGRVAQFLPNVFIAHDSLDGRFFSEIGIGDEVLYLDPELRRYQVTDVIEMQAVDPTSTTSDFIENGVTYTSLQVAERIYGNDLVLQTCIEKDGNPYWGRLFVIAEKQ